MSKRKILLGSLVATAAAAVIGGGIAAAIPASASVTTITAKTYSPLHPDTTSVSGSATQTLPDGNGPVWSYDNLHETITAKPESGPGNWNVTIRVGSGSNYHGFADPRTADEHSSDPGGILASQGTVTGTIQYDIQSSNTPNPSAVPQTEADGTGLGTALNQFFGGNYTIAGGGHYLFNYSNVGGATYTQNG
jgi:hypothetical protein